MSKITNDEIIQVKDSLSKIDPASLRIIRDNFVAMDDVLKAKLELDYWIDYDMAEILMTFGMGCHDSTRRICLVVLRKFREVTSECDPFDNNQFCKCCPFCQVCSGSGAKGDSQWHHNICLIWKDIMKDDLDLDAIRILYGRINPNDLQDLSDIVEAFPEAVNG